MKSSRQGWHRIRRRGIFRFDGERGYSGGPKRRIRRQTSIESQSWCCFIIEFQLFLGRCVVRGVRSSRGVLRIPPAHGLPPSDRGRRGGRRPRLTILFLDHDHVRILVRVLRARFSRLIGPWGGMSISQASCNLRGEHFVCSKFLLRAILKIKLVEGCSFLRVIDRINRYIWLKIKLFQLWLD